MKQFQIFGAIALGLSVAACGGGGSQSDEARMDKVYQFMMEEMDPAADGIWLKSGWVLTEEGEESLFPTTDEGWQEVADAADNLMAVNKKLQSEDYSGGDEEWVAIADGINVFAAQAKEAAQAQDEQELFDVGGDIYRVCRACHQRYIIDEEAN